MGLVDYGSDSGSEADDTPEVGLAKSSAASKPQPNDLPSSGLDDSYFTADDVFEGSSSLNLPSVIEPLSMGPAKAEGELEDMVKPKDWELKLAEKERRRMEKKAKKKAKKEKRKEDKSEPATVSNGEAKPSKAKAKIAAFGALKAIADQADSDSDTEQKAKPVVLPSKPKGSGLLSMLPTPKCAKGTVGLGGATNKGVGIMLPPSMRNKSVAPSTSAKKTTVTKRAAASDESDDDDLPTDFFGLSAAPEPKVPRIGDVPALVNGIADVVGPSRPINPDLAPEGMYGYPEVGPSSSQIKEEGVITDEDARKLIMKHEMGPMGTMDLRTLNSAAADIVDIRVDDALGPDVKATLLKNLHVAARAKDAMAPLPKSKNPADVTSKRKHQITYLANLAVAREEALQQQWAESKQMRRMGRQKYGF